LKERSLLERVLEQRLHHRRKQLGKGRPDLRRHNNKNNKNKIDNKIKMNNARTSSTGHSKSSWLSMRLSSISSATSQRLASSLSLYL
jgi:hypothetical protein